MGDRKWVKMPNQLWVKVDDKPDKGQCVTHQNPSQVSVKDLLDITILSPHNVGIRKPYDEVFDGILLGGQSTALNEDELQSLGVTHILNAAKGTKQFSHVNTNEQFYKSGIIFHGVPATDIMTFKISSYFEEAADFIANAIGTKNTGRKTGTVYVHCKEGVSRSATLVVAYLITHQEMALTDAMQTVRNKRAVSPNTGFLQQLIDYARKLDRCD